MKAIWIFLKTLLLEAGSFVGVVIAFFVACFVVIFLSGFIASALTVIIEPDLFSHFLTEVRPKYSMMVLLLDAGCLSMAVVLSVFLGVSGIRFLWTWVVDTWKMSKDQAS